MSDGLDLHGGQCPMETEERVLEHIVSLLPSPETGVAVKHLPGEPQEPVAGMVDEEFIGLPVPAAGQINESLQLGVRADRHLSAPAVGMGRSP
jgi:hypothetical protein